MLPELDGIRLAILGLHNCQDSTVLHMHASGPDSDAIDGPDELYASAMLWVRDSGGRWHATRTIGRSGMDGEVALRVEVVPPLSQGAAWIELLAAGHRPRSAPQCRFTGSDARPGRSAGPLAMPVRPGPRRKRDRPGIPHRGSRVGGNDG